MRNPNFTKHFFDQLKDRKNNLNNAFAVKLAKAIKTAINTDTRVYTLLNGDTNFQVMIDGTKYGIGFAFTGKDITITTYLTPAMAKRDARRCPSKMVAFAA